MYKKKVFLKSLIIYSAILIVIIIAGLLVLRSVLVSFEASRPDNAVDEFVLTSGKEYFLDGAQDAIRQGFNEFSDKNAALSDYGIDSAKELVWQSRGGDENFRYYDVKIGSSRFASITLELGEDVGFGMNSWKVKECTFSPGSETKLTLVLPVGAHAEINGIAVSNDYYSAEDEIQVAKKHEFDLQPEANAYTVTGLRGPSTVKAFDANGEELEPEELSPNTIQFIPRAEHGFSFYTIPQADVYVNGEKLKAEYSTEAFDYIYSGVALARYECSELFSEPEISVLVNGNEVQCVELGIGKCYIPDATSEPSKDVKLFIESFIKKYSEFSSNLGEDSYNNFSALSEYLLDGSELYKRTEESRDTIIWREGRAIKHKIIESYDFMPMLDGSFICYVHYAATVTYEAGTEEYDTTYVLVIVPSSDGYKVAGMFAKK